MKSVRYAICCCAVLALATTASAQDSKPEERFKFEAGYPTPEASKAPCTTKWTRDWITDCMAQE